jgi:glycerate-2-kinase
MDTASKTEAAGASRTPRDLLRGIAVEAIRSCDTGRAVSRAVSVEPGRIHVAGRPVRATPPGRLLVLGLGKAARPMIESFFDRLYAAGVRRPVRALVAAPEPEPAKSGKAGTGRDSGPPIAMQWIRGEHPVPGKGSFRAGTAAMRLFSGARAADDIVALVSGGGSSLMEGPLLPFVTAAETIRLNELLVVSGAPIAAINTVRKHLSAVKGGRLARLAHRARSITTLIVCDVDADRYEEVASGPTVPDRTTLDNMVEAADRYGLVPGLPERVLDGLRSEHMPETAKSKESIFRKARSLLLLSNADLRNAAVRAGLARGLAAEAMPTEITGPVDEAVEMVARAIEGAPTGLRLLVLGGETRTQPPPGGSGGRAQDFALRLALRMRNLSVRGWAFLAAGSDGIDGRSPAAGAFIDSDTLERARQAALDPEKILQRGDSYRLFHRLGDALVTGPTGTNVRDLYLLLTGLPRAERPVASPPADLPRPARPMIAPQRTTPVVVSPPHRPPPPAPPPASGRRKETRRVPARRAASRRSGTRRPATRRSAGGHSPARSAIRKKGRGRR